MNRKRFHSTADMPAAEEWLTSLLLKRQKPVTDRLLQSTRLTDLIYRSFAHENPEYVQKPGEPKFSSLENDLFTALYSPVLRKRDEATVHPDALHRNKPILDRILRDDRFSLLKELCEDKELPSYDAASAFCRALEEQLAGQTNTTAKTNPLPIILLLSEQAETLILRILDTKSNKTAEKRLALYNRLFGKLSQIEQLRKKAKEGAIRFTISLEETIDKAITEALERAQQTNAVMTAWGTGDGEMKNTLVNRELLSHVKNSSELMQIARSLGKYREILTAKRKNSFAYGLGEKYDITLGNDISNCLSSELSLLGTAETEILFMRKYEQKRLMQYRKRAAAVKGEGDMIVLIDESSSTRSVAGWAKAFALALLDVAAKGKRKFAMVHFSSASQVKTDLFEPGQYKPEDVMQAVEQFFGGGTDFEAPLREALWLLERGYENADITIITDGECRLSDTFTEEFNNKMLQYLVSVTGILLDKDGPCGQTLEPFCHKIYHSKDLTEDEIAVQILNDKAS